MNIGPRIWKTGLAVTLTLWITAMLQLEHSHLAAVAAVIALQPTITDSLRKGWERIQATAIGVALAVLVLYLLGSDPALVGLTVVVTIVIAVRYNLTGSIGLATVTVVVIMVGVGQTTVTYALQRIIILPFIGISVAVVINYVFSPPEYSTRFKDSLLNLNECIEMLMMRAVNCFLTSKQLDQHRAAQLKEQLEERYEEAKENFHRYAAEQGHRRQPHSPRSEWIRTHERALETLWFIAQRVLDMNHLAEERCERTGGFRKASKEYEGLLIPIQHMLFLIISLEKNLVEDFLDPDEKGDIRISEQMDELNGLRLELQQEIDRWQQGRLGVDHIRSLMDMVILLYDLDQISELLAGLNQLRTDSRRDSVGPSGAGGD